MEASFRSIVERVRGVNVGRTRPEAGKQGFASDLTFGRRTHYVARWTAVNVANAWRVATTSWTLRMCTP